MIRLFNIIVIAKYEQTDNTLRYVLSCNVCRGKILKKHPKQGGQFCTEKHNREHINVNMHVEYQTVTSTTNIRFVLNGITTEQNEFMSNDDESRRLI